MTETRLSRPPRDGVIRTAPFALRSGDADQPGDGLTIDGYAAVFNRKTLIDSWEGRFWEDIAPGAMKRSFREMTPKIQFDHGRHPMVGSIPIARLTTIEEASDPELAPDGGAHVVGRLHNNWLIQPVRDAIADGSVDGMSFRFTAIREEWRDADGKVIRDEDKLAELLRRSWLEEVPDEELLTRTLKEVRVPELGPVVFPAYTDTSVGVRSMLEHLSADDRRVLVRELAAELRPAADIPDLTGRPDARRAGGGDADDGDSTDAEPGHGDAIPPDDRARARTLRDRLLRVEGIIQ